MEIEGHVFHKLFVVQTAFDPRQQALADLMVAVPASIPHHSEKTVGLLVLWFICCLSFVSALPFEVVLRRVRGKRCLASILPMLTRPSLKCSDKYVLINTRTRTHNITHTSKLAHTHTSTHKHAQPESRKKRRCHYRTRDGRAGP